MRLRRACRLAAGRCRANVAPRRAATRAHALHDGEGKAAEGAANVVDSTGDGGIAATKGSGSSVAKKKRKCGAAVQAAPRTLTWGGQGGEPDGAPSPISWVRLQQQNAQIAAVPHRTADRERWTSSSVPYVKSGLIFLLMALFVGVALNTGGAANVREFTDVQQEVHSASPARSGEPRPRFV